MKLVTLKKRRDFVLSNKCGQKTHNKNFILQEYCNPNISDQGLMFGFTATKKIGNAVIRNRARRRLRAAMRECPQPVARSGLDYVMIARYDTAKREWQDLIRDVEKAVCYLHRQMDSQGVVYCMLGSSCKGGQV